MKVSVAGVVGGGRESRGVWGRFVVGLVGGCGNWEDIFGEVRELRDIRSF